MSPLYPEPSRALADARKQSAPEIHNLFQAFSSKVFSDGALCAKTKQIVAVAVAHVTQCPYCIAGHTKAALHQGASSAEIMEAIWIAAEMRAGAAYSHALIAMAECENGRSKRSAEPVARGDKP